MPTVTYLILPSVVKERMSLHDNVDDKLIYPEIKAVQDLYIMPLLGSTLFNKILSDLEIASNNKEIIFIKEKNETIKISLSTTRYLAKAGKFIKEYIEGEKMNENFKSLLEIIDKILNLEEKIK